MIIIDGSKEIDFAGRTKLAIGKFDGIHLGHRKLISEITSPEDGFKSLVFTFSFDSTFAFLKDDKIYSEEKRREIFEKLGVDYLVEYKLDKESAAIDPKLFVEDILVGKLHAGLIVAGSDVSFGNKGLGNAELLKELSPVYGYELKIIDKVKYMGEEISSTRIRKALEAGDIVSAEEMLGNKR